MDYFHRRHPTDKEYPFNPPPPRPRPPSRPRAHAPPIGLSIFSAQRLISPSLRRSGGASLPRLGPRVEIAQIGAGSLLTQVAFDAFEQGDEARLAREHRHARIHPQESPVPEPAGIRVFE